MRESLNNQSAVDVQSLIQGLTGKVFLLSEHTTSLDVGDWVRFQLDKNSFPIGKVTKVGINKVEILYQLVTFSRDLDQVLVKSDDKPLSNLRLDRDIVLSPEDPFFAE